jgi:hypothetical protein
LIAGEIERLEGFKVVLQEWEELKVFHYGTLVGCIRYKVAYIEIDKKLLNELNKYNFNLEAFMVENDINYQLTKTTKIYTPKPSPSLHYNIIWTGDHGGQISDSNLTCFFSFNYRKDGNHIELIYKDRPYCSHWPRYLNSELTPWFDALWADIKTNNRQPRQFNLAQRIGSYLPLNFKAFSDGFNKAEVQRTKKKYAYMTQRGERYIISKQPIPKDSDISTKTLREAVSLLLKMIDSSP